MITATLLFFIVLNFGISLLNAYSTGMAWVESKLAGGFARVMAWSGAIMAASGFTWAFMATFGVVAHVVGIMLHHPIPDKYLNGIFGLGYIMVIFPIIGSGLMITLDSWAHFYKNRTVANGAVAGWNGFAQISNMVNAFEDVPEAFGLIADMFKPSKDSDSDDVSGVLIMFALGAAIASLLSGILLTRYIVLSVAQGEYSKHYIQFGRRR